MLCTYTSGFHVLKSESEIENIVSITVQVSPDLSRSRQRRAHNLACWYWAAALT